MSLANRVVMTAMHLNYTPNGEVTDKLIDFYAARSRGGAGLVIIGGAEINDQSSGIDLMISIKDDKYIPGLKRFTGAIHDEGGKTAIQLYMAGAYSFCGLKGLPVLAPSEFTSHFSRQHTTPMTLEDIERVQQDFADAARRAKEAGFDAVEVIASAGYLISQFLSPKTNKREDEYGGPLENRMRFGLETIRRVKAVTGRDTALIVRVAGNDFVPGSHTNTEARVFAAAVQDAGADCINVTGGWHESRIPQITMDLPQAGYVYLAKGIKQNVSVPVIGCNRINDPFIAEEVLKEGVADLVGVARGLITDPEFVNKAKEGRTSEIRRCVACNQRCFDYVFQLLPVGCMVNPRAGKEAETELYPTDAPKKIIVAGAGPAGCEFAVTAAQRGHKVILCDKEDHIGGQVPWSANATHKPDFHYIFDYYRATLPKSGVELRLGAEVTPDLVAKEKPDIVVVATGAAPFKPPIEAVEAAHVVQAWDVLQGKIQTGADVVVVGGGSVGLETAVFLATKGTISPEQVYFLTLHQAEKPDVLRELMVKGVKNVTVIEMLRRIGQDMGPSTRWVVLKEVEMRGIKVITEARMKELTPGRVVYTDSQGNDVTIPADTVVLAMGSRPVNSLATALENSGADVRTIGDAKKVGRIGNAIEDGFTLAREL
ncbi:MAG: FAD-dependent oxidoreductase [Desulfomonile tiedjei]|uniref:FAD-dependent oxidoreductase n=1 Tax=Desulfomonile tiedjei TaxID=2358 RepID=A0A9D6V282_9BACT|nr:FAD-dependent oxidoreductase [Desulfomonile tiedjei]